MLANIIAYIQNCLLVKSYRRFYFFYTPILLLGFFFNPKIVEAQDSTYIDYNNTLLTHEKSGSLIIHSNGWGFNYRKGKNITGSLKKYYEGEFVTYKHPKETKVVNPYFENAKSYVYGKMNSVFFLRGGAGLQRTHYSKPYWGGVAIRTIYYAGASIAVLKPVYLNILELVSIPYYTYSPQRYDPSKHFTENIYGRASYFKGFNQLSIIPGAYGKFALNFEYSTWEREVRAVEAGISCDLFPKKLPVMAFNENNNLIFELYLSLHFGKRDL